MGLIYFYGIFCSDYKPNLMLCRYLEPRFQRFPSMPAGGQLVDLSLSQRDLSIDHSGTEEIWCSYELAGGQLVDLCLSLGTSCRYLEKKKGLTFFSHASWWVVSYPVS